MKILVIREKNLNQADRKSDTYICEYEGETPHVGDNLYFDGKYTGQVQSVARKIVNDKEIAVEVRI